MSDVTIFHNPACGTSRNVLALIRNSGVEPVVIEYLKTPLSRARLIELLAAMDIGVRDLLRRKGTPFEALKLDEAHWSDDQLIDFIVADPILMAKIWIGADTEG
jgi:arsenate reductase